MSGFLARLFWVAMLPAILAGCGHEGDEHSAEATPSELFTKYCSRCHGDKGQGVFIKGTPPIAQTRLTKPQIVALVVHGDSDDHKMPEFREMPPKSAEVIAEFVLRFSTPSDGR